MSAEEEELDMNPFEAHGNTEPKELPDKTKWKKNGTKKGKKTYKKQTSRLSTTIEKSMTLEKEDANNSIASENDIETFTMVSITVNLVVKEVIKPLPILIRNSTMVELLIKRAITEFNDGFAHESTLFRLIADHTQYGLKPSKKTGFPKCEMPSFNPKASIAETNCLQFTLIWKEASSDFAAYFVETKVKPKMTCRYCLLY